MLNQSSSDGNVSRRDNGAKKPNPKGQERTCFSTSRSRESADQASMKMEPGDTEDATINVKLPLRTTV